MAQFEQIDRAYTLREQIEAYDLGNESEPLRLENTILWDENAENCGDIACSDPGTIQSVFIRCTVQVPTHNHRWWSGDTMIL